MTDQPHADRSPDPTAGPDAGPDLRDAVCGYVRAVHRAYLEAGGGEAAGAGLPGDPFTVVAAAARSLHLVATRDDLTVDVPDGGRVEDHTSDLRWEVVFVDPSVAPELAEAPDGPDEIDAVKQTLGIDRTLYHLAVGAGSALSSHHAMHAGTGLAHRETGGGGA